MVDKITFVTWCRDCVFIVQIEFFHAYVKISLQNRNFCFVIYTRKIAFDISHAEKKPTKFSISLYLLSMSQTQWLLDRKRNCIFIHIEKKSQVVFILFRETRQSMKHWRNLTNSQLYLKSSFRIRWTIDQSDLWVSCNNFCFMQGNTSVKVKLDFL